MALQQSNVDVAPEGEAVVLEVLGFHQLFLADPIRRTPCLEPRSEASIHGP
jgi:hypothetical protein